MYLELLNIYSKLVPRAYHRMPNANNENGGSFVARVLHELSNNKPRNNCNEDTVLLHVNALNC
jgi:hypothetical protein